MGQVTSFLMNVVAFDLWNLTETCHEQIIFGHSDTLVGKPLVKSNRVKHWTDYVRDVHPDLVVLSADAHITRLEDFQDWCTVWWVIMGCIFRRSRVYGSHSSREDVMGTFLTLYLILPTGKNMQESDLFTITDSSRFMMLSQRMPSVIQNHQTSPFFWIWTTSISDQISCGQPWGQSILKGLLAYVPISSSGIFLPFFDTDDPVIF